MLLIFKNYHTFSLINHYGRDNLELEKLTSREGVFLHLNEMTETLQSVYLSYIDILSLETKIIS